MLLYSGSTNNTDRRLAEHRLKAWYAQVDRIEITEHRSRWRAALEERATGRGQHGSIRGGIGQRLAAFMTDEDLVEALSHPTYKRLSNVEMAMRWGIPVAKIRVLRTGIDRMSLLKTLGER